MLLRPCRTRAQAGAERCPRHLSEGRNGGQGQADIRGQVPHGVGDGGEMLTKQPYVKPQLQKLGLLRRETKFSF